MMVASELKKYKVGRIVEGCKIIRVEALKDLYAGMLILEHQKTGARIMQIIADDKNNFFNIFVPTYPLKSNGVAHILEHTTLCGSKKYAIRDSFFAMTKRSLNTFMNAMTGNDFTCYLASSMIEKDYFNLMDVYLDAVFFPNLRRMSFLQEGHRLEFTEIENPKSPLLYKGVVYNEMKGVLANSQRFLSFFIDQKLYPTTIYGQESGGLPLVIPSLTYEELKDFYQRHYHPSNTVFFFYGDVPVEKNIRYIQERVLSAFRKRPFLPPLKKEKRFLKPVQAKGFYPVDQYTGKDYFSGISWLTCDSSDPITIMGLEILISILTDYDHSPLRLALVDSGLAVDLVDLGIDSERNEISVSLGAKGVQKENVKRIQKTILKVLQDVAENGLKKEWVEIAFHAWELQTRERKEPFGLILSFRALLPFLRKLDPKIFLQPNSMIAEITGQISKGGFFEKLVKKWFLNNPHRVLFELTPDIHFREKENKQVAAQLRMLHKKLSVKQKEKIVQDALQLQKEQSLSDEKKNLDTLPCLALKDIQKNELKIQLTQKKIGKTPLYFSISPTNGVSYLSLEFAANHLHAEEKRLLPLLANLIASIGTQKRSFSDLSTAINLCSDGINIYPSNMVNLQTRQVSTCMRVSGNAIYRNTERFLDLIAEILTQPSFQNRKKVLEIVEMMCMEEYEGMSSSGHAVAALYANQFLTPLNYADAQMNGVSYFQYLKQYAKKIHKNYEGETKKLLALMEKIFIRGHLTIILSSEAANVKTYQNVLPSWLKNFKEGNYKRLPEPKFVVKRVYAGLQANTNVAYVVRSFPTVTYEHPDAAPLTVLASILGSNYMHTEVREKGGAYGGFVRYNRLTGIFAFASYRDPNINRTLQVYDQMIDHIKKNGITTDQVLEGVLQAFAPLNSPILPSNRANIEYSFITLGLNFKARSLFRKRLLSVTADQLIQVAKKYFEKPKIFSEAVLSGEELFSVAKKEMKKDRRKKLPVLLIKPK